MEGGEGWGKRVVGEGVGWGVGGRGLKYSDWWCPIV